MAVALTQHNLYILYTVLHSDMAINMRCAFCFHRGENYYWKPFSSSFTYWNWIEICHNESSVSIPLLWLSSSLRDCQSFSPRFPLSYHLFYSLHCGRTTTNLLLWSDSSLIIKCGLHLIITWLNYAHFFRIIWEQTKTKNLLNRFNFKWRNIVDEYIWIIFIW